ncbi:unnamed protein product [Amoebophrya sp. A25]|nr:unnamed protein product [Amoebophrya sp. A25]|eukprot:GSA25T00009080001.1
MSRDRDNDARVARCTDSCKPWCSFLLDDLCLIEVGRTFSSIRSRFVSKRVIEVGPTFSSGRW